LLEGNPSRPRPGVPSAPTIHPPGQPPVATPTKRKGRYFKRARQQRLKANGRTTAHRTSDFDDPIAYTVNKEDEIRLILAAGVGRRCSVIIDLDGTLISFQKGPARHRAPVFRSHFRSFVDALKPHAALFMFSAESATRSRNLFGKHLSDDFAGYFTPRHLYRGKKCLAEFSTPDHPIVIVDDSSYAVHPHSKDMHVEVQRWHGNPDDVGLIDALQKIRRFWVKHQRSKSPK